MWSQVLEKITDGTSGMLANDNPVAIVLGTSSKGNYVPLGLGKKSNVAEAIGYGEMPRRFQDMQKTMADCSVLALRTLGDVEGRVIGGTMRGSINATPIGSPLYFSQIDIDVLTEGHAGSAKLQITMTGDKVITETVLLPEDGLLELEDLGLTLDFTIEDADEMPVLYTSANSWAFVTYPVTSSYAVIEEAVKNVLELYTPEFIFIAQGVDVDFVQSLNALSERLFEDHKPVLFLCETNLDTTLSHTEAVTQKIEDFAPVDARFVSVVCQRGAVNTAQGKENRSPSGLCAGHITKSAVSQSIGATNQFAIYDYTLPQDWTNENSRNLDAKGFITLRTYAGLKNLFWANGRTMGGTTTDYRFVEIVRTVFKAIRMTRTAVLPYIQSHGDMTGVQNLLAEVRITLDNMTKATPKELDDFDVELPENQDIANNGVLLNIALFGIPIIRKIVLNFSFRYNNNK